MKTKCEQRCVFFCVFHSQIYWRIDSIRLQQLLVIYLQLYIMYRVFLDSRKDGHWTAVIGDNLILMTTLVYKNCLYQRLFKKYICLAIKRLVKIELYY